MPATVKLQHGLIIPIVGLGTGGKKSSNEETKNMVELALDMGYRHIDTAGVYDNEEVIGEVIERYIAEGRIERMDIFVCTKLPPINNKPELVKQSLELQLKKLRLDYVDMYLVHSPCALKNKGSLEMDMLKGAEYEFDEEQDYLPTWKAMEKLIDLGMTKYIGLSNFDVDQVRRVYENALIKPRNLQIEVHLHFAQNALVELCNELDIIVTAYAPIGCPGKKNVDVWKWPEEVDVDDPLVKELARKYEKTPAQILLRHLTQKHIVVIPKSTNPTRLQENLELFDFDLNKQDMDALNKVPQRKRLYAWPHTKAHRYYPFKDDEQLQK